MESKKNRTSHFVSRISKFKLMMVVITGGSKGLGKAFAEVFAKEGNTLLLCARNENTLIITVNELKQKYPQSDIHFTTADLSKKEEVLRFAKWCNEFGITDILINNAGRYLPGSVYNEDEGLLEKMMETNLYSAYHLTRALLPAMIEKKSGHIFNICSIASLQAYNNGGSYSISKFAMLGFNKNLREELKTHNIKVTAVVPGAALTDSWAGSGVEEERMMQAGDVAKMVYAASLLSVQACVEEIVMRPQLGDI
jgi:short-subunit dehydrogenase